jgi:hypothetical protein
MSLIKSKWVWYKMALNLVELVSETLVNWYFLILIIGGLLAAAWLLARLAGVSLEDMSSIVERLAIIGFFVGITALLTIGAAIYLLSNNIALPEGIDLVTIGFLAILGIVLLLRPIKDFRVGVFVSLAIGLFGAGILVFLGAESVRLLAIIFFIIFILIYGTLKLFEDLYLLIAELLASPVVSITIGVLCVVQGLLGVLGFSLGGIFTLLFGG